ncbi:WYL domain-containing transcriptional regulator [Halopseudomonas aestusnigri]|uniref:helix-turn-helix transcriptional regulator n=1 Tax=Halopseudomonas aestusnigri TaxID=857252 RepID=UPI0028C28FC7|nr:WYL domain-containing protein [Halopseudomonas aestusnigri]
MSDSKTTLQRIKVMISLIPKEPNDISAPELYRALLHQGFEVSLRTVQRDLDKASLSFPIYTAVEGHSPRWSRIRDAPLETDVMQPSTALALHLAESHLKKLLPGTVLQRLSGQFELARHQLLHDNGNVFHNWAKTVRALPNGKALQPAEISAQVWEAVSDALLRHRQLHICYQAREHGQTREHVLHPAGLVSRHAISYLIARTKRYEQPVQFALHRITTADVLPDSALPMEQFNIDDYIRRQLNAESDITSVILEADVAPSIAWILNETPLSDEQSLTPLEGTKWQHLRAVVPDDKETRWWVYSLGENIRLHAPTDWADEVQARARQVLDLYSI